MSGTSIFLAAGCRRFMLTLLILAPLLSGCAGNQQTRSGNPEARPSGEENLSARLHTELAAGYFARAQYAVALQELRKALDADNNYAPAYSILGVVHAELREDKDAETHYRRAVELSPNYSEAHNNFGLFLCKRGRPAEALKHFEAALANPLYATPEMALANAGNCALEKGDLAQAELYFGRSLKRVSNQTAALLGMADLHSRQGRWLAARSVLRQLGAQFGDLAELGAQALWLGVRAERQLGDREAEANYGAQLRRRYPESMQAQWLISGQYDQLGSPL
ncbi:MAG: type IV pilus biogenesis/stability protein PilW [Hydrogenophilales bacterium 28-61-23]|nr:MAG: type IV pilus biogenesis/stability protein PilW [Hydrogenophilales bacterium 28-61-23]